MKDFTSIRLEDKAPISDILSQDPPQVSELTFTNLYMWRCRYRPLWRIRNNVLLVIFQPPDQEPFALPPAGSGDKAEAGEYLLDGLREISGEPRICRAPSSFVETAVDMDRYHVVPDPDNSDYVYHAQDLITLSGNKYHSKKNHVNKFVKQYDYEYRSLDYELVEACLDLQEDWCELRDCESKPGLFQENMAIYEALHHVRELGFTGGAILLESKVEAFSFGEMLNPETAVIHAEKANPEIPGLYAAINQFFCQDAWAEVTYVNREQDLGVTGIRKAKQSYHPHHMVDKFTITKKS
jgi:hypothetical protein